jgi:hypothetical protein
MVEGTEWLVEAIFRPHPQFVLVLATGTNGLKLCKRRSVAPMWLGIGTLLPLPLPCVDVRDECADTSVSEYLQFSLKSVDLVVVLLGYLAVGS